MQPGFSAITTSKYYHPSFNSAIFDGPIRIYFVQFHETFALNIYFQIQECFKESIVQLKDMAKKNESTVAIMIYPTEDSYLKAFELTSNEPTPLLKSKKGRESIIGMLAPITETNVSQLMDELSDIFKLWESDSLAKVVSSNTSVLLQEVV